MNVNTPSGEPSVDDDCCPKCGSYDRGWKKCRECGGEGGYHDCGEDCCCCLDKDEITHDCPVCHGRGGYMVCYGCIAKAEKNRKAQTK